MYDDVLSYVFMSHKIQTKSRNISENTSDYTPSVLHFKRMHIETTKSLKLEEFSRFPHSKTILINVTEENT